ncbi:DUF1707 SHOCT-like domain-containing protein [Corynebacterium mayonis]|uniref:DUF1707 SHOCT-like domain-containing protein n=1 Tax=Corynebacterium mayonis TaxID=3062461 RepID=UPI0031402932
MNSYDVPDVPRRRASNWEREEVSRVLSSAFSDGQLSLSEFDERSATVWEATWADELKSLTADLAPLPTPSRAASPLDTSTLVDPNATGSGHTFSVLGVSEMKGTWAVAPRHLSFTLVGENTLDLRQAVLTSNEIVITCISILGVINIIVPDGVHVISEGVGILGEFKHTSRDGASQPVNAPIIRLRGWALLGEVTITFFPEI